jgi:FkbM family methyltransferase
MHKIEWGYVRHFSGLSLGGWPSAQGCLPKKDRFHFRFHKTSRSVAITMKPHDMFVSYAQNFEDVILWRALKHVRKGFYIDVGAQDPVAASVSLAFYEKGWRGVHVEPVPDYAAKLRQARPDEQVLEAAISNVNGKFTMHEISGTGLSTGDSQIAKLHETKGFARKQIDVNSLPLSELLDRYSNREIHWLKIDVEGLEDQVVESWSPSKVRPWIVVIEATKPNTPEQSHMSWEPQLLRLGYQFAYFDGLNRFYVSNSRPDLKSNFGAGPNLFDNFILNDTSSFSRERHAIAELAAVYASTSWRITRPLRFLRRMISWLAAQVAAWVIWRKVKNAPVGPELRASSPRRGESARTLPLPKRRATTENSPWFIRPLPR